jgi:hypothetical protein
MAWKTDPEEKLVFFELNQWDAQSGRQRDRTILSLVATDPWRMAMTFTQSIVCVQNAYHIMISVHELAEKATVLLHLTYLLELLNFLETVLLNGFRCPLDFQVQQYNWCSVLEYNSTTGVRSWGLSQNVALFSGCESFLTMILKLRNLSQIFSDMRKL